MGEIDGFDNVGALTWKFEREVRLSDGKPFDDISQSEEAELLDSQNQYLPGVLGEQRYRAIWNAGQPFDTTTIEPIDSGGLDTVIARTL